MHHSTRGFRSLPARLTAGFAATALGVGLSLSGVPVAHAADSNFCSDGTQPYAPVSEVEAFAAGTAVNGLSVTSGTTPDSFTGSYVGYIGDALGKGKDMLLFRLSSPVIDGTDGLKPAGIWAGMSGSPVYTSDHKLIGAVAYSLNYDNLPIAGVTPAEYMKAIGSTAVGTASKITTTKANLHVASNLPTKTAAAVSGASFTPVKTVNIAGKAGTKENAYTNRALARTPKSVKGSSFLRSRSFQPAAAQSSSLTEGLVAGGSIAVLYTSADLTIGAIGTVTAICGNTVWAFGHPMDHNGATKLMMANASTAMIVPDGTGWVGSYKQVSRIGEPLGLITQDRMVGIRGTQGAVATFGVDVTVQDPHGAQVATYHTDVVDQKYAATATAYLTGQAVYEQLDQWGGTGEVTWTINFTRADNTTGSLTNSQVAADPDYLPDTLSTYPAEDVWAIISNGLEDVTITGVEVNVTLVDSDAITYALTGAKVQATGSSTWANLNGSKLKPGGSYSIQPQYIEKVNGTRTGTLKPGTAVSVKLSSKAAKSGSFSVLAVNDATSACDDDDDCDDVSADTSGFDSFDDLLASLEGQTSNSAIEALLKYKLKKGSTSKVFDSTGPGVVTGSATDTFSIKK